MQRTSLVIVGLLSIVCIMAWHVPSASGQATAGWVTLFDGTHLDHWQSIGDANWRLEDGVVVADKGSGFLVSKEAYADFQLRVEFWVDEDANSGIFIRCTIPDKIGTDSGYEVNIYDKRPDPSYGTGAIVNVAKVEPMPKAGGQWNVYEITAQGPTFTVTLNGHKTVDGVQDTKFGSGRIALQYGASVVKDKGVVKFRKVEIKPL
jgi:hypothetical protein